MKNVLSKLNAARTAFHSMELKKSGRNTFANYSYFSLGDFLIPALKVFAEVGLTAVVSFEKEVATMTIYCVETGENLVITSPMGTAALKGCHEVQNIGAVETYQRRYLWVAALEIVEHDALDESAPISVYQAQADRIISLFKHSVSDAAAEAKDAPDEVWQLLPANVRSGIKDFNALSSLAPDVVAQLQDLAEEVTGLVNTGDTAAAEERIRLLNMPDVEKKALANMMPAAVTEKIKLAAAAYRKVAKDQAMKQAMERNRT